MKEISWQELPYNARTQGLNAAMLHPEGFKIQKNVRRANLGEVLITYDREFVKHVIIETVLKPLYFTSYNEAQKIYSEAWNSYKASSIRGKTQAVLLPSSDASEVRTETTGS